MADAIRKAIKKVRHKFKPQQKMETPLQRLIIQIKSENYRNEFWERDKKQQRSLSFEKAKIVLKNKLAEKQKRREAMLENLAKARKAKEKKNERTEKTD